MVLSTPASAASPSAGHQKCDRINKRSCANSSIRGNPSAKSPEPSTSIPQPSIGAARRQRVCEVLMSVFRPPQPHGPVNGGAIALIFLLLLYRPVLYKPVGTVVKVVGVTPNRSSQRSRMRLMRLTPCKQPCILKRLDMLAHGRLPISGHSRNVLNLTSAKSACYDFGQIGAA